MSAYSWKVQGTGVILAVTKSDVFFKSDVFLTLLSIYLYRFKINKLRWEKTLAMPLSPGGYRGSGYSEDTAARHEDDE